MRLINKLKDKLKIKSSIDYKVLGHIKKLKILCKKNLIFSNFNALSY